MNLKPTAPSFLLLVVALILALSGAAPASAAAVTANARGSFGSGNTTYGEQEVSGLSLPPDGSTGLQEAGNTHLTAGATGISNLSNSAIAGSSFWIGGSVIDLPSGTGGTVWNLNANSLTRLEDTLTVNSSTLPIGTPVQVLFSLHAASATFADHNHGVSMNNNFGFVNSSISGTARSLASSSRIDILAADHQIIRDTTGSSATKNSGLLNPNTPHLDLVLDAHVGEEIALLFNITTAAFGKLSPFPPDPSSTDQENAAGKVSSAISVAFGATASSSDVTLSSELFGGSFPAAAEANAANAAIGLSMAQVPEPSSAALLLTGVGVLLRRRGPDRADWS